MTHLYVRPYRTRGLTVYYGIKLLTLYATGFLILPPLTISAIYSTILNGNGRYTIQFVIK